MLGLMLIAILGYAIDVPGDNTGGDVMCVPMGDILLEAPEGVQAKRASVVFPHAGHFSFECKVCHHKWSGDAHIQTCMASGCHDLAESPEKSGTGMDDDAEARYYKNAFHTLCIGCHKKIKTDNQKKEFSAGILKSPLPNPGPTGCVNCHPRTE
jgi:hypothetical protein